MGTIVPIMRTKYFNSGAADALFSSTKQRLFSLLFGGSERSFYARELISLTGSGTGAVRENSSNYQKMG